MVNEVLISTDQLRNRIKELGEQITKDYGGKSLVCVGILKGAFIFLADIVRQIDLPLSVDFISTSSYGSSIESSGNVKLLLDIKQDIRGKHVLIVEDIIDTGLTIKYLLDMLGKREPASISVCTLLRKDNYDHDIKINYFGFDVPHDAFVVGFGMDHADNYRNLPYVGLVRNS